MTDDEINNMIAQRREEIARFIQGHKSELFSAALIHHQTTAIPGGMFAVLEAYCTEFYGKERAFQFALDSIAEAALLECSTPKAVAPELATFAARLGEVQKSLRPRTLSEVAGVPANTLRSYLLGKTTPTLTRLSEIAERAGYRPEWLAFGVGPRKEAVCPQ